MIENKEQSSKAGAIPEEFMNWLKPFASQYAKNEDVHISYVFDLAKKVYRHLSTQPSYPRWVSVETGLPEDNERIIFYTTGYSRNEMRMGSFVKKDQWERENMFIGDGYFHEQNVSHWMPVPQEPDPTHTAQ